MGRYVSRRVLQFIPVLFGATLLIFAMVFALPGDPVRALFGNRPVPQTLINEIADNYNLNDPFAVQYGKYMGVVPDDETGQFEGVLPCLTFGAVGECDLGSDFRGQRVTAIMGRRFPVTLKLTLGAFVFEAILGIIAGLMAGLNRASFVDNLVRVATVAIVSVPTFVLGYLGQIIFGLQLGWFPIAGVRAGWLSYVLPSMILGALSLGFIARLLRTQLVENLGADYVRTAKAKGLSRGRVTGVHTLRNSLIPVITYIGVDIGALMGGAVVTETVFNMPGIGRAVYEAILAQEGTVVVGIITALVLVFLIANLLVDILYAYLDPRIRYE